MTGVVHAAGDPAVRLELGMAFREYVMDPNDFIGVQVLGSYPVRRKVGKWPKLLKEHFLRAAERVKRAAGTNVSRSGIKSDDLTYTCVQRAHETKIPQEDLELYSSEYEVEQAALEHAFHKVVLDQEVDIAAAIFDGTTSFTVANGRRTDVTTAWGTASADIIGDVQSAKESVRSRTGNNPNTLIIGAAVVPMLMKNSGLRDALKYTERAGIEAMKAALGALLGLDRILIGGAVQNTANEGATASIADIWGSGWAAIARTAAPGSSLATPCIGRSLFWIDDANTETAMVEQYREPGTRSNVYRALSHADELLTDLDQLQLLDIAG